MDRSHTRAEQARGGTAAPRRHGFKPFARPADYARNIQGLPEFGLRPNKPKHKKCMGGASAELYKFRNDGRVEDRCLSILHVAVDLGAAKQQMDAIVQYLDGSGYRMECASNTPLETVDRISGVDADILIVGSASLKHAPDYLRELIRGGWLGIVPYRDMLVYGTDFSRGSEPMRLLDGPPVCSGPEFARDGISLIHNHLRRRDDFDAMRGDHAVIWNDISLYLANIVGNGPDMLESFRTKLNGDGLGGPDVDMLLAALNTLRCMGTRKIEAEIASFDNIAKKHGRPPVLPNVRPRTAGEFYTKWGTERRVRGLACMVEQWFEGYGRPTVEQRWMEWHELLFGEPPHEGLHDLVKRKGWVKLLAKMQGPVWGPKWQALVTALLDENEGIRVLDVETETPLGGCACKCDQCSARCVCTCDRCVGNASYDVDLLVELSGHEIPMQVGTLVGSAVSDYDVLVGPHLLPANTHAGYLDKGVSQERDTGRIRRKIRQIKENGIALVGIGRVQPSDDWLCANMKDKCLILLKEDGTSDIYHSAPDWLVDTAKCICGVFGSSEPITTRIRPRPGPGKCPQFCPDTKDGLTAAIQRDPDTWVADVTGALPYPEFASAYCASMRDLGLKGLKGLVPTIKHTVDRYMESRGHEDGNSWCRAMHDSLNALNSILNESLVQVPVPELVDTASALRDMVWKLDAEKSGDECDGRSILEIPKKPHLYALYNMVRIVGRLGNDAPPETLETLTAVAKRAKQEGGTGYRIVLGAMLGVLASNQPKWYAEKESLLFGASDGLDVVLMGAYMMRNNGWRPLMEKYPHLAREAVRDAKEGCSDNRMYVFMSCVFNGVKGYDMKDSILFLSEAGVLEVAVSVCTWLVNDEAGRTDNTTKLYSAAIRFWETALDIVPGQAGKFGNMRFAEPVKRDDWRRLMLKTCELAKGVVTRPVHVAASVFDDGYNETGMKILELILQANPDVSKDLAVQHALNQIPDDGEYNALLERAGLK